MCPLRAIDLAVDMFVPHLLSGFACMNFLSNVSSDIALVRGRYGCRPGAFFLYFGCRYLSLLSMIMLLVWFDVYAAAPIDTLNYICKAAAALSLAFAYSIMVVRICAWFPNTYFCLALELSALAFWGLTVAGTEYMRPQRGSVLTCRVTVFSLSTGALVGALFYVLYVRRGDHRFRIRQCGKLLWKENMPELALIWGVAFPGTVLYYLDRSANCESSSYSERSCSCKSHPALVITQKGANALHSTILVCRLYRTMIERLDYCPIDNYSPVYGRCVLPSSFLFLFLSCPQSTILNAA
ncbi:hypothetical protein C8Q74DRAFT_1191174 [Fomes fomentarius]|nr:hypothetical protein C8Q74DRAFT_1191174 [Fomes fomentarius]